MLSARIGRVLRIKLADTCDVEIMMMEYDIKI